jgi:hypothetical protein
MPAGGSYERTRKEGGGSTSVFPFEIWEYRHIPGIGDDIVLEFVDDEGGGLYELTWDEHRKDELLYSSGMGATWDEMEANLGDLGVAEHTSKQFRVARRRFAGDQAGPYRHAGYFETERDRPFSELILSSQLNSAPQVKFKDQERVVNSAIYYDMIGFDLDAAAFHTGPEQALVTVTVQIPHRALNFKDLGGDILQAKAEVLGRVEDLGGSIHTVFEEGVAREIPASQQIRTTAGASVFQKQMLLPAGLYKLTVVVKDTETGQMGTSVRRIDVPRYAEEDLAVSSLVLAQEIGAAQDADSGQFQLGSLKVLPRVTGEFRKDEDLGFYFQVYNTALDQTSNLPDLKVEFAIADRGVPPSFWRDCSRVASLAGSYLTVARLSSLLRYEPGKYTLHIRVSDQISEQTVPEPRAAEPRAFSPGYPDERSPEGEFRPLTVG